MITRKKNQIRPRSMTVKFDNAEIIAMSNDGLERIVIPDAAPSRIVPSHLEVFTNIVAVYTNISPSANNPFHDIYFQNTLLGIQTIDDCDAVMSYSPAFVGFTKLYGTMGQNRYEGNCPDPTLTQFEYTETRKMGAIPDGAIVTVLTNPAGAFTGGNVANYMEIILYYWLIG